MWREEGRRLTVERKKSADYQFLLITKSQRPFVDEVQQQPPAEAELNRADPPVDCLLCFPSLLFT